MLRRRGPVGSSGVRDGGGSGGGGVGGFKNAEKMPDMGGGGGRRLVSGLDGQMSSPRRPQAAEGGGVVRVVIARTRDGLEAVELATGRLLSAVALPSAASGAGVYVDLNGDGVVDHVQVRWEAKKGETLKNAEKNLLRKGISGWCANARVGLGGGR